MNIVNFAIPQTLAKDIDEVIKIEGFMSKAEFFRSLAKRYIDQIKGRTLDNTNREYTQVMSEISDLLEEKLANKKLPSLEKQFKDLK